MLADFTAFTLKSDRQLRVLKTKVRIRLAQSIAKPYGLDMNDLEVVAIWDTGATHTAVSTKIAEKLNLKPITKAEVTAAGTSYISNVYKVDILLPNKVAVNDVRVTEAKNIEDSEILVGMDIITIGDFAVTNAEQETFFSFRYPPADKHIDYYREAELIKQKRKRRKHQKK